MNKLLSLLLICLSAPLFGQSDAFRFMQEKYPDARGVFLYQSTMRAFNVDNNADFEKLVSDLDKVSILFMGDVEPGAESSEQDPEELKDYQKIKVDREDFNTVIGKLQEDDYQEMFSLQADGQKSLIYGEEGDDPESFVIVFSNDNGVVIADIKGTLDISLLFKLRDSSPELLQGIIKGDGFF